MAKPTLTSFNNSYKVALYYFRSIFGRCYALCAYLRMIYAALYVAFVFARTTFQPDVIFCDQVNWLLATLKKYLSPSATKWILRGRHVPRLSFFCHDDSYDYIATFLSNASFVLLRKDFIRGRSW